MRSLYYVKEEDTRLVMLNVSEEDRKRGVILSFAPLVEGYEEMVSGELVPVYRTLQEGEKIVTAEEATAMWEAAINEA